MWKTGNTYESGFRLQYQAGLTSKAVSFLLNEPTRGQTARFNKNPNNIECD